MAFNVVTLVFKAINKFSGTTKKIDGDLKKVNNTMKKTERQAKKTGKSMGLMGKTLKKIPGPLKALAAGFIGLQAMKAAVRMVNDFEDALLDLQAITGASGADLQFLKQASFELGTEFAKTGAEILTGMKLVASAKPELLENVDALKAVTREALKLSQAAGIDMTLAANAAAQSLNIFGLDASHAARIVNLLAAESKFGASEVADTSEALIKAGPAARFAGLEIEQLTSLIEALAKGGLKGRIAGTGLNSTILKLTEAGFDFRKQSLDEVFMKIKTGLEGVKDPAQRAAALIKLVGLENVKTASTLIENAGTLDQYTQKITGTNIATEQAAIRSKSLRFKIGQLGSVVEEKVVKTFEKMRPVITAVIDKVNEMIGELSPDTLEAIGAAFSVIGWALWGMLQILDIMLKPLELLLSLLTKIGKLTGLVFAEIFSGGKLEFFKEVKNIFGFGAEVGGEINININDKGGNVDSVSTNGDGVQLPVGMNMPAGA